MPACDGQAGIGGHTGRYTHPALSERKEFADFARVEEATDAVFYFALPHHPRRRGANENTNGPVREYFPKAPTSTRSATTGSGRCMMRSTAGRANATASGRTTRSTIRRRCTCSENSRSKIHTNFLISSFTYGRYVFLDKGLIKITVKYKIMHAIIDNNDLKKPVL